ncbi:MBL fold metallo-hydrolase [Mixta tenebrionis]|uniref:MBL fold metallo-hydrolase n=1 Tax=Mixta tenebrionis TaxID=2562439 RepID=A0A506V8H7_9GAMM|nr:MBL fold metallo-hydrolase [Mixta tenebrionis]TPW41997.1 MBL fold metallo-hydrolase [Mixta tenebrionis]
MRIHHLSCGSMCPFGGALYDGFSKGLHAHLVCHCLLIETDADGLVLVDTGFGEEDMGHHSRIAAFFRRFNNIQRRPELSALAQVKRLGFQPQDVRHIILTHLDFDHAGGLTDFPHAQVHLMQQELDAVRHRDGWLQQRRYRPAQWPARTNWQAYQPQGESWQGFAAVSALKGLPPEILLIPLPGHTPGHAGVAIQQRDGWLLHGGDAWFYRGEMYQQTRHCTPGLRFYQWMMAADNAARRENQQRLRALSLSQQGKITLFCSHDAKELARMQALRP